MKRYSNGISHGVEVEESTRLPVSGSSSPIAPIDTDFSVSDLDTDSLSSTPITSPLLTNSGLPPQINDLNAHYLWDNNALSTRISQLEEELESTRQDAERRADVAYRALQDAERRAEEAERRAEEEERKAIQATTRARCLANSIRIRSTPSSGQASDNSEPPPYSPSESHASPDGNNHLSTKRGQAAANEYSVTIQRVVLGSTLVTVGSGLDIQSVICGFDNGLIEIRNLPTQATTSDIEALFTAINTRFCIIDIRQYETDMIATVSVREDIKQRIADEINVKTVRKNVITAKVLESTIGYSALRHHALHLHWKAPEPIQDFHDALRKRLASTSGLACFDFPAGRDYFWGTYSSTAWFRSQTSAKQAYDSLNGKEFGPGSSVKCSLEQCKPIKYALVLPLEQCYLHESGGPIKYTGASVPTDKGLHVRIKNLGCDWFNGVKWFDDEKARTFFGSDLRREVPGVAVTKWDYITRTLTVYADTETSIKQVSTLIDSFANQSKLATFAERIDRSVANSLSRSGRLEKLKREDEISFEVLRSQDVLTYRGGQSFFAVRRLMEEIELGEFNADANGPKSTCTVCLSKVSKSVYLVCGHEYCILCLKNHVQKPPKKVGLPIVCIGDAGKCQWRIAIPIIQSLLSPFEFQILIEEVATTYIDQRPEQYRRCPTSGCTQVYRCNIAPKYITCSFCSVALCPSCHSHAHASISCANWAAINHPKNQKCSSQWSSLGGKNTKCPICKAFLVSEDGCSYVYCQTCKVYKCCVCNEPSYQDSLEIYAHLRTHPDN